MFTINMLMSLLYPLIYLAVIVLLYFMIKLLLLNSKFKRSGYAKASGNGFFKTVFSTGNNGEYLIFVILEKLSGNKRLFDQRISSKAKRRNYRN